MKAFTTMLRVTVKQLLGRKWVILVGLVGLLPSLIMLVQSRAQNSGILSAVYTEGPLLTLFFFVLPLTSILLASLALGEERRDGTLSFLVLRPIRKETVVGAKLAAAWVSAWMITAASGILSATVLGLASGVWRMVLPVIVATGISTLAYAGVFLLLGYLTRWAVLIGAGFLFFWETGIAFAADSLANVSLFRIGLTAFSAMIGQSHGPLGDALGALRPGTGGAVAKAAVIATVSILAVAALIRRRDLT